MLNRDRITALGRTEPAPLPSRSHPPPTSPQPAQPIATTSTLQPQATALAGTVCVRFTPEWGSEEAPESRHHTAHAFDILSRTKVATLHSSMLMAMCFT